MIKNASGLLRQGAETVIDQRMLLSAQFLPREIAGFKEVGWDKVGESWGVKIVGNVNKELFSVQLAPGWTLRHQVNGSAWSFVYDPLGRERASVYYGGTTEARSARMYLYRRYNFVTVYGDPSDDSLRIVVGRDERRIFREFGRIFADDANYFIKVDQVRREAEAWFDREYPEWRDPFAYWNSAP